MRITGIIALRWSDPLRRPQDGQTKHRCDHCSTNVVLDRYSLALLPAPVYCLECYTQLRDLHDCPRVRIVEVQE